MIILKTTFHIDDDMHKEGLRYLKEIYIPKAIASGEMYGPVLVHILVDYEEQGGSYSLKLRVKDKATLTKWTNEVGGALQLDMVEKFGEKLVSFVTLGERLEL